MPAAACAILRAAPTSAASGSADAGALNGCDPSAASASWLAKPTASGGAPATATEQVSPGDQVRACTHRPLRIGPEVAISHGYPVRCDRALLGSG